MAQEQQTAELAPNTFYRRHLPGTDFSLEANTREVPKKGCFYLLKRGGVVFSSPKFPEALHAYHELCQSYWEERLEADDATERLTAAWGLLGIDPDHKVAAEIIREEGEPDEKKRLEGIRRRNAAMKRKRAMMSRRKKSEATAA
ncbi:MAG: hypothetical protein ACK47B_18790 [Armatimonadota bacterium]